MTTNIFILYGNLKIQDYTIVTHNTFFVLVNIKENCIFKVGLIQIAVNNSLNSFSMVGILATEKTPHNISGTINYKYNINSLKSISIYNTPQKIFMWVWKYIFHIGQSMARRPSTSDTRSKQFLDSPRSYGMGIWVYAIQTTPLFTHLISLVNLRYTELPEWPDFNHKQDTTNKYPASPCTQYCALHLPPYWLKGFEELY